MQTVNDLIEDLQRLPKWAREREAQLRIEPSGAAHVTVEMDGTLVQGATHADCRVCADRRMQEEIAEEDRTRGTAI